MYLLLRLVFLATLLTLTAGVSAQDSPARVMILPGIEKILEAAVKIEPRVYSVFGGFHLTEVPDAEVSSLVARFRDNWKFERVAAGHCTGEFAFSEFNRVYGPKYDRAVVGAVIALPR